MVNPCEDANISARRRAVPLLYNIGGPKLYVVKKYRSPTTQRESVELSNKIKNLIVTAPWEKKDASKLLKVGSK